MTKQIVLGALTGEKVSHHVYTTAPVYEVFERCVVVRHPHIIWLAVSISCFLRMANGLYTTETTQVDQGAESGPLRPSDAEPIPCQPKTFHRERDWHLPTFLASRLQ